MKEKLKQYGFSACAFALSLITALFFVALRVNYSGISKFLGADTNPSFLVMNLPVMVCVLAWVGVGFAVAGLFCGKKAKWPTIVGFVIGLIMLIGAVVVVMFGAYDYLRFILVHFRKSLGVTACILIFAGVLLFPVARKSRKVLAVKCGVIALAVLLAVVIGYGLRPCGFTYGAVVYAVEDTYQIVFSTSDSAICWVEIGAERYYDLYAGSMRSVDGVHKVTVPQEVLDEAGGYTVCAQQMIYRGPFGGYTGDTIFQSYAFRPVDTSDGLNYYTLSDVHEAVEPAVAAAVNGHTENLDFIILLGDLVSMVETEADAQLANELAHGITGGEIPVIYARGNHEIKGEYGEVLYKYVGSLNQSFHYPVTLGGEVFAVVLDMGEDHEDDWWEYYGTAQFDLYRADQTRMLEELLEAGEYENYRYRMAICHIPFVYVDRHGYFESFRNEWTELLNRMEMDICFSGHKHVLWALLPGCVEPHTSPMALNPDFSGAEGKTDKGYLTDFAFPTFLAGRRSLEQMGDTQQFGYSQYVGMMTRVDFAAGTQTSFYVNSLGQVLECAYPFVDGTYTEVVTEIQRPE